MSEKTRAKHWNTARWLQRRAMETHRAMARERPAEQISFADKVRTVELTYGSRAPRPKEKARAKAPKVASRGAGKQAGAPAAAAPAGAGDAAAATGS